MSKNNNLNSHSLNNEANNTMHSESYDHMMKGNRDWAADRVKEDPEYFTRLAKGQSPEILWIGCADSRVPANEITNTKPGEVFVHRNIANVCVHTDMNMLSVLDYAVNVLKVKHVVVAGHYGCGGVAAAMGTKQVGIIDNWLRHIKDVYRLHAKELEAITDDQQRVNRLVELNVVEQVNNLCHTTIIQNAWQERNDLEVHGVVIDLTTGLLRDLGISSSSPDHLVNVYKFDAATLGIE
jgi:carbonic anhydrase